MRSVGESHVHVCPYLGSAISADCRTRPQYVERSYCDAGKSRFPGKEADILNIRTSCTQEKLRVDRCVLQQIVSVQISAGGVNLYRIVLLGLTSAFGGCYDN